MAHRTSTRPKSRYTHRVRRRTLALCALPVICAVILVRCSIYDASLLLPASQEAGSGDAVAPTNDGAAADGSVDPCAHVHAPLQPTTEDGTGDVDMVLAASYIRVLPSGTISLPHPALPMGLDLDNTCTCPGPETCKGLSGTPHCDGDGGTDNSTGGVFTSFAALTSDFSDDALNASLRAGASTVLFRVKGYNGGQNDKQVTFIVYTSRGLYRGPPSDAGTDDAASPPQYDGTDIWSIDPSSLLGGSSVDAGMSCEGNDTVCVPLYADTEAYVKDGELVAHVDFPITIGPAGTSLVLTISAATLHAKLIPDGASFRIDDGQIAGRFNAGGMITALGVSTDPVTKKGALCNNQIVYQNIKARVCNAADIMTHPIDDNTGKACDALSIAISFSASPGHLGPLQGKGQGGDACDAGWKDDCP